MRSLNMQNVRIRFDRLADACRRDDGPRSRTTFEALIRRVRQRFAERAARTARGEPEPVEPVLTIEEQWQRARAFRARMRELGVLPPLPNTEEP